MKIYWYWPHPHRRPSAVAAAMVGDHDRLVVEALQSYRGEGLPQFADYELVRDLPDPVVPEVGLLRGVRRLTLPIHRVLARRRQFRRGFDVAHIETITYEVDAFDLPRLARKTPIVAVVHDVEPHVKRWPKLIQNFLHRRVYSADIDLVVAHPSLAQRLCTEHAVPAERVHVVPFALHAPHEVPPMGEQGEVVSLLFLGTLRSNKGLPVLLEAFAQLPAGTFHLTIAGRGDAELERLANEFARGRSDVSAEIGHVSEDRKWQLLAECNVVVLPYESFASQSAVLVEAYAARRPVVVTDVGALGDTVRDDATGVVVRPGSVEALVAGLMAIAKWSRPDLATMLERAAARHSAPAVGRQLREVYAKAVDRRLATARPTRLHLLTKRFRGVRRQAANVRSHPANRGRLVRQWWAILRFEAASTVGRGVNLSFAEKSRVRCRKRGDSSGRVAFARWPDWPEMQVWSRWLRPGDVFVDVGANVGLYSLVAAEREAQIVAFEPAPDMADAFEENMRLNGLDRWELHRVAALDRPGWADLAGPDPNRRRVAAAEIEPLDEQPMGGSVPVRTLDEVLAGTAVRGMKIDVEGVEKLVLMGGVGALRNPTLELIQIEWNDACVAALGESRAPVAELLVAAGFSLYQCPEGAERFLPFGSAVPPMGRDVIAARGRAQALLEAAPWVAARHA